MKEIIEKWKTQGQALGLEDYDLEAHILLGITIELKRELNPDLKLQDQMEVLQVLINYFGSE